MCRKYDGVVGIQPLWLIVGAMLIYLPREHTLVDHGFCRMKQEILLRHMGIINIHGYCHARVHAGVTPSSLSSFRVSLR